MIRRIHTETTETERRVYLADDTGTVLRLLFVRRVTNGRESWPLKDSRPLHEKAA